MNRYLMGMLLVGQDHHRFRHARHLATGDGYGRLSWAEEIVASLVEDLASGPE